jgi:hypothetical protein
MGDSADRRAMITRLCWWLAELVCRTLQPAEREAVLGDIDECGETGIHALRDVLGLVIRRQAAMWMDWRPWMILIAVISPLAMSLSLVSRPIADESAVYAWLYVNNWDWALLRNAGFWFVFGESTRLVLTRYMTLVCWAWTAGLVLGATSRKMQLRANSVLFCLMLLFGAFVGVPRYLAYLRHVFSPHPRPDVHVPPFHGPVFALTFYGAIFPLIVQTVLVAVPALWGIREGAKSGRLQPALRTTLWTLAAVTVAAMVIQTPGLGAFLWMYGRPELWLVGQLRLPQFILCWPVAYLFATAIGRRRHARLASI